MNLLGETHAFCSPSQNDSQLQKHLLHKRAQTLSHLGDMTIGADARGWTPEATLGEGESHLVKANAVDPKL